VLHLVSAEMLTVTLDTEGVAHSDDADGFPIAVRVAFSAFPTSLWQVAVLGMEVGPAPSVGVADYCPPQADKPRIVKTAIKEIEILRITAPSLLKKSSHWNVRMIRFFLFMRIFPPCLQLIGIAQADVEIFWEFRRGIAWRFIKPGLRIRAGGREHPQFGIRPLRRTPGVNCSEF
jgi:hypothetical protein